MNIITSNYQNLLDYLYNHHNFADFLEYGTEESFVDWCYNLPKLPFKIDWGSSKGVISDPDFPYVLKFPFDFYRSHARNYCEIEYQNYQDAKDFPEILDRFAWADFLFTYKGYPVYIMEKVNCDGDEILSRAFDFSYSSYCKKNESILSLAKHKTGDFEKKILSDFSDLFHCYYSPREQMSDLLIEQIGAARTKLFWDFCDEREINDLHSGNWGLRGNDLILVDYSGYFGNPYSYSSYTS